MLIRLISIVLLTALLPVKLSLAGSSDYPKISIIIDDLGNDLASDNRAVNLPGAITCSILPHTYFSRLMAQRCHARKKVVMLHLPMQAISRQALGPGGLTARMDYEKFASVLDRDLASLPFVCGVNNHMGSLLTQRSADMGWLMQAIKRRGLFFVDSRTSKHTIASEVAMDAGVPSISRDVFLDHIASYAEIDIQFQRLLQIAKRNGQAVAIGHPYPATLDYLEQVLPELAAAGYQLVPVSELVE